MDDIMKPTNAKNKHTKYPRKEKANMKYIIAGVDEEMKRMRATTLKNIQRKEEYREIERR